MPIIKRTISSKFKKDFTKIENERLITPIPELSFPINVSENSTTLGIITNAEPNEYYIITCNRGIINYEGGNTFEYIAENIENTESVEAVIKIQGIILKRIPSNILSRSVMIHDVSDATPIPIVDFPTEVNRNSIITAIINNHTSGKTYDFIVTLGTYEYIGGNTFTYTSPDNQTSGLIEDTIVMIAKMAGKENSNALVINVDVTNEDTAVETPTLSILGSVQEGENITGAITNYDDDVVYDISCLNGTISDIVTNTFLFTGGMINNSSVMTNDTITIIGEKWGINSNPLNRIIEVVNTVSTIPSDTDIPSSIGEDSTIIINITADAGDIIDLEVDFGVLSDVSNGVFTYDAPMVTVDTTVTFIATATGINKSISSPLVIVSEIANLVQLAEPVFTFPNEININEDNTIIFDNFVVGITYIIAPTVGSISGQINDTFIYTGPATIIPDNGSISIIAVRNGYSNSNAITKNFDIHLGKLDTPDIIITENCNEGDILIGTINNFDSEVTYVFGETNGTIVYTPGETTFTFTAITPIESGVIGEVTCYSTRVEYSDSDISSDLISIMDTPNHPFYGYPCEFSHFSKYHQNNILKTTTSSSNLTEWQTILDYIPVALSGSQAIAYNNYVYLLGGYDTDTTTLRSEIYRSSVVENGELIIFQPYGNLPIALSGHQTIVVGTRLYLFGGMDSTSSVISSVWYSEIAANGDLGSWIAVTDLPIETSYHQVIITKNRIYLLGGFNEEFQNIPTVYYAAIDENDNIGTWFLDVNVIPVIDFPVKAVRTKSRVYLIGREDDLVYSEIDSDGILGVWTIIPTALPSTITPLVITVGNRIFVMGDDTNNIHYADIDSNGHIDSFFTITNSLNYVAPGSSVVVTLDYINLLGGETRNMQRSWLPDFFDGWISGQSTSRCPGDPVETTDTPTTDMPGNVDENSVTTVTITNHITGRVYSISASEGTISNIVDDTFDYTAPDLSATTVASLHVQGWDSNKYGSVVNTTSFNIIDYTLPDSTTPTLDDTSDISEDTTRTYTITNYNTNYTYNLTSNPNGIIDNINGNNFDYTVPLVATEMSTWINIEVTEPDHSPAELLHNFNILNDAITDTPTFTFAGTPNANENETYSGTITNYNAAFNYDIICNFGIINNISNDTFDYTSNPVSTDTLDTISITAQESLKEVSSPVDISFTILNNDISAIPDFTMDSDVDEGNTVSVTITNYDANNTYSASADNGGVVEDPITSATFDFTAPMITTPTDVIVSLTSTEPGNVISPPRDFSTTINNSQSAQPGGTFASTVNEETTTAGTITGWETGITYRYEVSHGSIANTTNDSFDFTAPAIGATIPAATISIYATKAGDTESLPIIHTFEIFNIGTLSEPTMTLNITPNELEESAAIITNHISGNTYTITSDPTGTIIGDSSTGNFGFIPPEVADHTAGTVSVTAHHDGCSDSDTLVYDITIQNVPPGDSPFTGYPCEFSHFSKYEKQNILKTTTTDDITGWTIESGGSDGGNRPQIIVTSSRIYTIGGNNNNTMRYASIDAAGNMGTWHTDAITLPTNLSNTRAIITKNRVYLLGGYVTFHNPINNTYYADIDSSGHIGSWSAGGDLAYATSAAQVVITKDKVFLISGKNSSSNTATTNIMKADIDSNGVLGAWATYTASSVNHGVFNSAIVRTKSRLYLIGGHDSHAKNHIQYTEIDNNGDISAWTDDTVLPVLRYGHITITTKNKVYLLGGHNGSSAVNNMYSADIDSNGHLSTFTLAGTLPSTMFLIPYVVTKSKIYGFLRDTTDMWSAPFDGWDPRMDDATSTNYPYTQEPTLSIADVKESITTQGTITNHEVDETYVITAVLGTISNAVNDTFDYTAPDVNSNSVDTITIVGTIPGMLESIPLIHDINIIGNPFTGYPCEFSHFSKYEKQNILKTTTTDDITGWTVDSGTISSGRAQIVVTSSRIYSIGGNSNNTMRYADIDVAGNIGTWHTDAITLPTNLGETRAIIIKNRVYLLGGYITLHNPINNTYYADIDSSGHIGSWSAGGNLSYIVSAAQVAITKDKIFLISGKNSSSNTATTNIMKADIDSNGVLGAWGTYASSVNHGVFNSAIVRTKSRLYLIGGHDNTARNYVQYTEIDSNGDIGSWINDTALPVNRTGHTTITTNNKVYLLGGYNGSAHINTIYSADIDSNGHLSTFTLVTGTLPAAAAHFPHIITKSKIYGFPNSSTDMWSAPFDGWDPRMDDATSINYPYTQEPTLSIAANIKESITTQGTITNHVVGTTYTISALEGTISNAVDDTFDYTAPSVSSNDTDTITIVGTAPGAEDSIPLVHTVNILDSPFTGYPCEFSHFSKYEKQNILKTTTTTDDITGWTVESGVAIDSNMSQIVITSSRIYSIGGYNDNTMRYADIDAAGNIGTWYTDAITLPTNLGETRAIIIKNRVYLLGGYVTFHNPINNTYYADIDGNGHIGSWSAGGNLSYIVSAAQVAITKDKIFLISGKHSGANSATTSIMKADIDSNGILGAWETYASSVNHGLFNSAIVRTKSRLYLIGGHNNAVRNYVQYTEIDSNGDIGAWTDDTVLPVACYGHTTITTKNKVYLLGGRDGTVMVNTIYSADIDSSGHLSTFTLVTGTLPTPKMLSPYAITKSKIYGFPRDTTDLWSAPFDGWDPRMDDATSTNYPYTSEPILSIAANILEEALVTGTITNYIAGTTYTITALEGTISNAVDDTFDYTAPSVSSNDTDTITIVGTAPGAEDSIPLVHTVNILDSPFTGYPCEFSHFTKLHKTNLAKTTTITGDITITTLGSTLPQTIKNSHIIVTSTRIYTIGGIVNGVLDDRVFYTPLDEVGNVGTWVENVANVPPVALRDGQLIMTDHRVYLLGGHDGTDAVNTIYYADIIDGEIGSWSTDTETLPVTLSSSQAVITKDRVYLLGGLVSSETNAIYYADIDSSGVIGSWSTDANTLPTAIRSGQVILTKARVYYAGGYSSAASTDVIYYADIDSSGVIGSWSTDANTLINATSEHKILTTLNKAYLIGGFTNTEIDAVAHATIDANGHIGTWTANSSNLPNIITAGDIVISSNICYYLGGKAVADTDAILQITFDGWDARTDDSTAIK